MSEYRTAWEVFMSDCDAMDEHTHVKADHDRIRALEGLVIELSKGGVIDTVICPSCGHKHFETLVWGFEVDGRNSIIDTECDECGAEIRCHYRCREWIDVSLQHPQDHTHPAGDEQPDGEADDG